MSALLSAPVAAAVLACLALPAFAHAVLDRTEAQPNATYRGAIRIAHGCQGSPTVAVRVTIPEGVIAAKPMPKPGWTLATTRGPYERSYASYHGPVSAGVKEIEWRGGPLPDDQFDEFTFTALLTEAHAPGALVHFPVIQECERGAHRWTEVPGAGQTARDLKAPAPSVRVVQATADASGPVARAGALAVAQTWTRATPGGARVAGGYLRLTNAGPEPDRLLGGTFERAGRVEVHEMAAADGVMRMRPVEGGILVPPGGTVELKPGGYHLMFMDLSAGLKEGEAVAGTLTFERAGSVAVVFRVGGLGTSQAPAGQHH